MADDQLEHATTVDVVTTGNGLYRAVCTCGWTGDYPDEPTARDAGRRHAENPPPEPVTVHANVKA